jgi:branched-chain amino acid aminotransferase
MKGQQARPDRARPPDSATGRVALVNGALVPEQDATVPVFDHGLLFGDGVYDTMFAHRRKIFRLEQHLARLRRSCSAIGLVPPNTDAELRGAVLMTARSNDLPEAYIKVMVTRGVGRQPLLDPRNCEPTVIVFVQPYLNQMPRERVAKGLSAKIASTRRMGARVLDPRVKSLNYLPFILARMEATRAGHDDALLLDDEGNVCEAAGSNLFIVDGGQVRTPDRSILEGITRRAVLDLCTELGLISRQEVLAPADVAHADEVFLTSTAGGLMPITSIEGHSVGNGVPGPVYLRLRNAFRSRIDAGWDCTAFD